MSFIYVIKDQSRSADICKILSENGSHAKYAIRPSQEPTYSNGMQQIILPIPTVGSVKDPPWLLDESLMHVDHAHLQESSVRNRSPVRDVVLEESRANMKNPKL